MKNTYLVGILEVFKEMESLFTTYYKNIANTLGTNDKIVRNMALVLSREEKSHIDFYEKLIDEFSEDEDIIIEQDLFVNSTQTLMEFKKLITANKINNKEDLLRTALFYEEKGAETVKDLLDIFHENKTDLNKNFIDILETIYNEELKHAKNIKIFLQNLEKAKGE